MAARLGLGAITRPKFTRTQWFWIAGGVVAALIGLRSMFGGTPPPVYLTQAVTHGNLALSVSATGTLAPRDQVDVGAEVSGRIDAVLVDFNDHVKKGEKLARINTLNFEAALAQSRASLAQAQATLVQAAQIRARTAAPAQGQRGVAPGDRYRPMPTGCAPRPASGWRRRRSIPTRPRSPRRRSMPRWTASCSTAKCRRARPWSRR